jgi:uncharacterized membrane protein YeaQ/YmgE (transglycosylase-associated protein family)
MRIVILVVLGWVIGLCATVLLPGKTKPGFVAMTLIGIGGALIAVLIGRALGWWHRGDAPGFFLSLGAAIALLAIYRAVKAKTA